MKRALIALVAVAALVAAGWVLPIGSWAVTVVRWIHSTGAVGIAAYALVYVAAVLVLVPASLLTLGAGFVYGPLWGAVLVTPLTVIAATLGFALARSSLRSALEKRITGHRRFSALDRAIAVEGFKIVLLLRLSLIAPFGLSNYALGLTRIRLRPYALASLLGMFPGTVLFAYLGSLATSAAQLSSGVAGVAGQWQQPLYWGGLAVTAVVTLALTLTARRALRRSLEQASGDEDRDRPLTRAPRARARRPYDGARM